jgi:O-antigen ligase
VLWWILRWVFGRLNPLSPLLKYSAAIAVSLSAIAVFITVRLVGGLGSVSGETATFNSRGVLWSVSWSGFLLKPFHGWGWMAAWHTPNFLRQGEWWVLWDTNWSHNGYHDLLLGGGILPLLLFVGVVFWSVQTLDRQPKMSIALPRLLVIGFVLTAATQESFFIGSHFLWALLIAALFAGETVSQTSIKQ